MRQHGFRQNTESESTDIVTSAILTDHSDGPASMWEYKYEPPPPRSGAAHLIQILYLRLMIVWQCDQKTAFARAPSLGTCVIGMFRESRIWLVHSTVFLFLMQTYRAGIPRALRTWSACFQERRDSIKIFLRGTSQA